MTEAEAGPTLEEVFDLEEVDRDLYRSNLVYPDQHALYGGQVVAQALLAAGRTVEPGRPPHSLHAYFLRAGDASRPTVFRVERDRDGGSFSARRVVAVQDAEVICSVSCSFSRPSAGLDRTVTAPPQAEDPEALPEWTLPRLFGLSSRLPQQPYPDASWPTRLWAKTSAPLPDDPLLHASVLTWFSDIASGTSAFEGSGERTATSLDHAVWFHRPLRMDEWVLMDLVPQTMAGGRGWYTGTVHDAAGRLGASLTQEILSRPRRR